jgi:hypothetical protein
MKAIKRLIVAPVFLIIMVTATFHFIAHPHNTKLGTALDRWFRKLHHWASK